jgi:hypothetical protein
MACNCNAKYDNKVPCCCSTGNRVVCTTTKCPDAQPCDATLESNCVIYNGNDYDCVGVENGMTVTNVIDIILETLNLIDCTTTTTSAPTTTSTSTTTSSTTTTTTECPLCETSVFTLNGSPTYVINSVTADGTPIILSGGATFPVTSTVIGFTTPNPKGSSVTINVTTNGSLPLQTMIITTCNYTQCYLLETGTFDYTFPNVPIGCTVSVTFGVSQAGNSCLIL